ncbi:MAG: YCF48-related protein [Gammaproteobacteria bacterium]|nr:YCF48-related protein [Gammaproteobacteria bacterium]
MKEIVTLGRLFGIQAALFFVLASIVLSAHAQEANGLEAGIEVIRSGIPHDALFGLEMTGEWGMAVGNFGLMLETTDGGLNWAVLPPKTTLALFGITHAGDHQVIVGQKGFVMVRAEGEEWREIDSGIEVRLLNVAMNPSGFALVVGEFGFFARSRDHGETWEPLTIDWMEYNDEGYEPHLYDAIVNADGTLMIAGEFGLILRSEDGGDTWHDVARGEESVFAIRLANDGSHTGYAVGQEGLMLKTSDDGLTWERLEVDTNANLLGVWAGNSEVVAAGIRTLLRSSDDGASFTATGDYNVIRTWFQAVDAGVTESTAGGKGFMRQQIIYIVGHQGTIARVLK